MWVWWCRWEALHTCSLLWHEQEDRDKNTAGLEVLGGGPVVGVVVSTFSSSWVPLVGLADVLPSPWPLELESVLVCFTNPFEVSISSVSDSLQTSYILEILIAAFAVIFWTEYIFYITWGGGGTKWDINVERRFLRKILLFYFYF